MSFREFIVLCLALARVASQGCEVLVPEPWPEPYLYIPKNTTTVRMNCTAVDEDDSAFWAADLGSDSKMVQFRSTDEDFNANGLFELSAIGTPPTLRLLINNTVLNNGTVVICHRDSKELSTTLIVVEPSPFIITVLKMDVNAIDISWSENSTSTSKTVQQTFFLTISHGSNQTVIQLNESFFAFTAPEDAPPCEVYNFSVTATYVGATYNGASCSEPSPVFSTMLPGLLPDVDKLESSFAHSIMKQTSSSEGVTLLISYTLPTDCPTYDYSLILHDSTSNQTYVHKVTPMDLQGRIVKVYFKDLPENSELNFKISVSHSVAETVSNGVDIYTTDVQYVQAAVANVSTSPTTITVQCGFIPNSNAKGCAVVLVSELKNFTVNLTRDVNGNILCAERMLTLNMPLSGIVGYDIESDGTIGAIGIPGQVTTMESVGLSCQSGGITPTSRPTLGLSITLLGTVAGILVVAVLAVLVITIVLCRCNSKRRSTRLAPSSPAKPHKGSEENTDNSHSDSMPFYDLPENLTPSLKSNSLVRGLVDGTSYSRTCHSLQVSPSPQGDNESAKYDMVNESEHLYHVLEGSEQTDTPHEVVIIPSDTESPELHAHASESNEHLYHVLEGNALPDQQQSTPGSLPRYSPPTTAAPPSPPQRYPPPTTPAPLSPPQRYPPPTTSAPPLPPNHDLSSTESTHAVYEEVNTLPPVSASEERTTTTTTTNHEQFLTQSLPSSPLRIGPPQLETSGGAPIYQDIAELSLPRTRRAVQQFYTGRLRSHSVSTIVRTVV